MLFYIALIWNTRDQARNEAAVTLLKRFIKNRQNWKVCVDEPGLVVCHYLSSTTEVDEAYILEGGGGVVLGKLFEKSYATRADAAGFPPSRVTLGERASAEIVNSGGRHLTERYWGRYVAFLKSKQSGKCWIIRDPTGALPCQWMRVRGIDVYFLRQSDCDSLDLHRFSVNRDFLAAYLILGRPCTNATGLNEIQTVLAGERIEHDGDARTSSFVWNPLEIADANPLEDPNEAAMRMRTTVRACVHAWASCFESILHHLSGGLDSSIVASCLADAPTRPQVTCQNLYAGDPGSDERAYARLVAARFGFRLIERPASREQRFTTVEEMPSVPVPFPWWLGGSEAGLKEGESLRSAGVQAHFNGHGGDELFYCGDILPTAIDFAWRRGLRAELFTLALNDAQAEGASFWHVLRAVRHYGLLKRPWHIRRIVPREAVPLMVVGVKAQALRSETIWHPLFQDYARIAPVKYNHAYVLTHGSHHIHVPARHDFSLASISPLRSQPFIELSLCTPVYVLKSGGRDRALARRAFATDLPGQITRRKSKAYADDQMRAVVSRHIKTVRELLLDGFLVQEGLVDRARLQRALDGDLSSRESGILEICSYLDVEGWVRHWSGSRRQAAA